MVWRSVDWITCHLPSLFQYSSLRSLNIKASSQKTGLVAEAKWQSGRDFISLLYCALLPFPVIRLVILSFAPSFFIHTSVSTVTFILLYCFLLPILIPVSLSLSFSASFSHSSTARLPSTTNFFFSICKLCERVLGELGRGWKSYFFFLVVKIL